MWGETEWKTKRREVTSRVQLLLLLLTSLQKGKSRECKALSVIVSTNQSCFTGRLLHVLLVSFSLLPDLSLLSPGGSACSVFAFLSVYLYLCLSVSISLPLCLSPHPYPINTSF